MSTEETIKTYYDLYNAGEWEAWLALFADPFVVKAQNACLNDRSSLSSVVNRIKGRFSGSALVPLRVVVSGYEGFVSWRFQGVGETGLSSEGTGVSFFEVRAGEIALMEDLVGSNYFSKVMLIEAMASHERAFSHYY